MTRKISVSTKKGGCLKTSIVVNTAGLLAKDGYKVLIVDTDDQGDVSLSFGMQPDEFENTIYDVMVSGLDPRKAIVNVYENIDIIPCNDDLGFLEFDVVGKAEYPEPYMLLNPLKEIESDYDFILFDTPPSLGLSQGNVLSYVNEVIIPFQPEVYSMRSLVKILNAIESFKQESNPSLRVLGVVPTLVDRRTKLHQKIIEKCEEYCQDIDVRIFKSEIPRLIKYADSIAEAGLPETLKNWTPLKKLVNLKKKKDDPYMKLKGEILNG